jgi:hypothetical protein
MIASIRASAPFSSRDRSLWTQSTRWTDLLIAYSAHKYESPTRRGGSGPVSDPRGTQVGSPAHLGSRSVDLATRPDSSDGIVGSAAVLTRVGVCQGQRGSTLFITVSNGPSSDPFCAESVEAHATSMVPEEAAADAPPHRSGCQGP